MSAAAIVVGPVQISGVCPVEVELAATAIQSVDDELALVGDRVVEVDGLWREVLGSAAGRACDALTLICPSWWPVARVERVGAAAGACSAHVVVLRRAEVSTATTVVEIAPELVVVHAGAQRHVIARVGPSSGVLAAVVASVEGLAEVTVDVPAGVGRFGTDLVRALRRRGVEVTVADDQTLVRAVRARFDSVRHDVAPTQRRRPTPRAAAIAVAVLSASALAATAIGLDADVEQPDVTWLVEGRVAVEIPAHWTVERITSGPGSARVQVVSPGDPSDAIHVTQSQVPDEPTLEAAAASLSSALAEQPSGVFVDFTASGERAHRDAITYRELRADRRIDWTVVLDGDVRIAIGCQGSADRPAPVELCDRAIWSAHAVRRK